MDTDHRFLWVPHIRRHVERRREDGLEDAQSLAAAEDDTPEALVLQRDLEAAARKVLGTMREEREEDLRAVLAAIAETRPAGDATFRKRLQRAIARLRLAWRTKHGT